MDGMNVSFSQVVAVLAGLALFAGEFVIAYDRRFFRWLANCVALAIVAALLLAAARALG